MGTKDAPVALPGAAGPWEAQTAPRTRPSHSRERLGGGISAPEHPLHGDGDRFRQGRAAPAACPSSETQENSEAVVAAAQAGPGASASTPARDPGHSRRSPDSSAAAAPPRGPAHLADLLAGSGGSAHLFERLAVAYRPCKTGAQWLFPDVLKDIRCNHCPQPAVSRLFAFAPAMLFT